ncbi:MAG: 50S ribosomal protein L17 [Dehalococcoidia bacterium]|nr:50S ribosomal protein L17 [Dehalococcoidia bacterium]
MQHMKSGRHLSRDSAARRALYRSQVTDLLRHEHIVTTEAKAKEVRGLAEKMITLGKGKTLHHRRQALEFVYDDTVVKKLFGELAPRYEARVGGYTRLIRLGPRKGDNAPMVKLELV